jgi:uncharacterized glyoxalase superfamily protein PhnB
MKMESTVEVAVDPMTAFVAFTEEMDHWWGNGPIDAWSFSRSIGRQVEPGVGGRVLELYDNDALELARVTIWEPGRRVAWKSSIDDVTIEVRFETGGIGTIVRVEGHVPDGGQGGAGLAVLRMTPQWLPRYFARGRRPWPPLDPLLVVIHYARPAAAARWLCEAFGFEPTGDIPEEEPTEHGWTELRSGGSAFVLLPAEGETTNVSHEVLLFVNDLEAHFERSQRAGVKIVQPIKTHGFTSYVAVDIEGRQWIFAEASPRQSEPISIS